MQRLVELALRFQALVALLTVVLIGAGVFAWSHLNIEAYPNPVPPMIEVIAQPNGWGAEEVERMVTIPLETALSGMKGLDHIRSQSLFGLADVKCYFNWDTSYRDARQDVLNRLAFVDLPGDVTPSISPWNAIGELYRYVLRGPGYSLTDLKTTQDWILERQFRQVPGVVDVTGFGGYLRQYQVEIDPTRLRAYDVSLSDVMRAIGNGNQNAGGQRITVGEQSFTIRGLGLISTLTDIDNIVVRELDGVPVRVRDIATVRRGAAPRLGIVGKDADDDIVQGIVLMRYGAASLPTIHNIHERVEYINRNRILPPGMKIEPYYDRSALVGVTTHTVTENLVVGMGLVTLILLLFLGNLRAALIAAVNIPLALMCAFIGMVATGTSANLLSLGAVDFGIVVDATVIMLENIARQLDVFGHGSITDRIRKAASEVGGPMFVSTLIITTAFVPLMSLQGSEGVIFSPMAHTYAYAIGGAIVLALTATPVLAARVLKISTHKPGEPIPEGLSGEEPHEGVMKYVARVYEPVFHLALSRPWLAIGLAVAPVAVALFVATRLGGEFMPKLEEGNLWIRATLPLSVSLEQSSQYTRRMRDIVRGCPLEGSCDEARRTRPEVATVVSQNGRPDDGTDVSGFYNIELFTPLRPRGEWRRGLTKDQLVTELRADLTAAFPGIGFNFSQAISDNVQEALSGVKGENTIKVIGPDLRINEDKANEIVAALKSVPGVTDLGLFRTLGQPSIKITPDRVRCARYGLNVGDVQDVIQAAVGGKAVTQVFESEKRFDLTVRFAEPFRRSVQTLREIPVTTPNGQPVPLTLLADISEEDGAVNVYREDFERYVPIKFSVRGRDLASTIADAKQRVADVVQIPYDTRLEWGGEINQMKSALARLGLVVPGSLALIAFFIYALTRRAWATALVLMGIPVACAGGVLALAASGAPFSIAAAMGFISVFGISVQDALLVVSYAQQLGAEGHSPADRARLAAERRLRPALMTAFVALFGLLPAALSNGIGSETQKPLAVVVIGGTLALMVLPRLLQPALIRLLGDRLLPRPAALES